MVEHAAWKPEERQAKPERGGEPQRRADDSAEPEWVLEQIQQTFETRRE